jgi:hypothetical protein
MAKVSELIAEIQQTEASGGDASALRQYVTDKGYGQKLPPPPPVRQPQKGSGSPLAIPGEIASAFNRGIMDTADFLGPGTINAGLSLAGVDARLPTFGGAFRENVPGAEGGFMDEGMGRDAAQGFGAAMTAAPSMVSVPRNLATAGGSAAELLGFGTQAAPGVSQAAAQAANMSGDLTGGPASEIIRRADELGWPLSFGDRTGNRTIKGIESAIESTPMVANPMHNINDRRQEILRDTAAEAMGLPKGTRLTDDVIGDVATGLSDEFTSLQGLDDMPVTETFADSLIATQNSAKTRLFSDPQIEETINKVFDKIDDSGRLTVSNYQDMTSELKAKVRQAWKGDSPDPYFAESLAEIIESLDELAMNNVDPSALSKLKRARARWKALSTLEKSRSIHESGEVSGPLLANYLRRTDKPGYGRGGNTSDLYEAARMSKAFPSRPDSGTAGRQLINNMLQNPTSSALSLLVSPAVSTLSNAFVRGPSGVERLARAVSPHRAPLMAAGRQLGNELFGEEENTPY